MSVIRLLLREIQYRKLNFALGLVSVVAAVALPVSILTMCEASNREIIRLMRNLGFNLIIVPAETNMSDFWDRQYADKTMPEEYVTKLSESRTLMVQHLVARLQQKIEWRGRKVLLTGALPEVPMRYGAQKSPMDMPIPQGKAYLGFELANSTGLKAGDTLELTAKGRTRKYTIAKTLREQGSLDDIRILLHLHDAQDLLNMPGRVTDIQALSCYCKGADLSTLRASLAQEFPDTRVSELRTQYLVRAETRATIERYAAFLLPAVLVICAIWVGLLALSNVRDRRHEIGILRAMGVSSVKVAALFLGKAVLLGLVGAAIGFPVGTWIALRWGPDVFPVTAGKFAAETQYLWWALIGAPLLCALASYLPAMVAVTQDPAEVLREE
jgi:ABC-type lipoprotein release transport system permease subunit